MVHWFVAKKGTFGKHLYVEFSGVQVLLTELPPPSCPYCSLFITVQQSFPHWSWGISLSATSGVLLGLLLLCQIISIFPVLLPSQSRGSCKCRTCPCWGNLTQQYSLLCFFGLGFLIGFFCFPGFPPTFLEMLLDFMCFLQHAPSSPHRVLCVGITNTLTGPVPFLGNCLAFL